MVTYLHNSYIVSDLGSSYEKVKHDHDLKDKRINYVKSKYSSLSYLTRGKRLLKWLLTDKELSALMHGNCAYCGSLPSNKGLYFPRSLGIFKYSGIDRIDSKGDYEYSNTCSCCFVCNRAKSSLGVVEFLDWVKKIHKHQGFAK